jgi:hypothetical protein
VQLRLLPVKAGVGIDGDLAIFRQVFLLLTALGIIIRLAWDEKYGRRNVGINHMAVIRLPLLILRTLK